MPARPKAILSPILGLYLGQAAITVPARALKDGQNFRIKQDRLSNLNLGWAPTFAVENTITTKALLHFSGPDASGTIREGAVGASDVRWTASGNAQLDTAQFKFGPSSLLLDGTGDWVSRPDGSDITLGSSNFRIFLEFNTIGLTGANRRIAGQAVAGEGAAGSAWFFNFEPGSPNDHIRAMVSNGSAFTALDGTVQYTDVVNPGWHQVELIRMGNVLYLFEDGILTASAAFTGAVNDSAAALFVGTSDGAASPFTGWVDEFYMDIGGTYPIVNHPVRTSAFKQALSGPTMLVDTFFIRGASEIQIFGSNRDLYRYDADQDALFFINPTYNVGTVDVSSANPAVVTANTGVPNWVTNGIKTGDKIIFETSAFFEPDAKWYEIATVNGEGQLTLTTSVVATPFTNIGYMIRRTFTNDTDEPWDFDTFVAPDDGVGDDLWVATNGVDPVVSWDGIAASVIRRTSLGFKAKRVAVWKHMLVYANILMDSGELLPQDIINSDIGKPFDVVNGLAGQFRVHDGVDHLLEIEDLGDNLSIYAERHLINTQFVGDPLVFVFREAATGIGPFASRAVADFGDYHKFLGADSQYKFDGVSVTETGKQVWREVLRLRDPTRHQHAYHHFDEENGELHWATPLTTDVGVGDQTKPPEWAYVEHYLEEVGPDIQTPVSKRQMPFNSEGYGVTRGVVTWNELNIPWEEANFRWNESFLFSAFPTNLVGTSDGRVMTLNVSQTGNGVLLPSFVRFGRRPLGDGRNRGLLKRVYPFATFLPGQSLIVTGFFYDHAAGQASYSAQAELDTDLPEEGHFVVLYRRGRFVELQFGTDGGGWQLEGYDMDVAPGGMR